MAAQLVAVVDGGTADGGTADGGTVDGGMGAQLMGGGANEQATAAADGGGS
jgi:hypothetical protein